MKTNRALMREAFLAGVAVFLAVPTVKTPGYQEVFAANSSLSVPSETQKLASPNSKLEPRPIRTWECLSSWYGEDFDGQITANGEMYDMYAQTAAHLTLPLGSILRVVDLRTQRSAIVRINDRGPYVPGREIDVSYQVARELGFAGRGVARVRLELLEVPSSKEHPPAN